MSQNAWKYSFFSAFLFILVLGVGACANTAENDPCFDFQCNENETCLVVNGEPMCSPIGDGDGDGDGGQGEMCETDADCTPPLTCIDQNGIPVCT